MPYQLYLWRETLDRYNILMCWRRKRKIGHWTVFECTSMRLLCKFRVYCSVCVFFVYFITECTENWNLVMIFSELVCSKMDSFDLAFIFCWRELVVVEVRYRKFAKGRKKWKKNVLKIEEMTEINVLSHKLSSINRKTKWTTKNANSVWIKYRPNCLTKKNMIFFPQN